MSTQTSPAASKESILTGYRLVIHAQALLVLVQALIAGQYLYGDWSIVSHGILGNVSFVLAVVAVVLCIVGKLPKGLTIIAVVLVVAMIAQIGLGYSTEGTPSAGSWHIPLGVTIFGIVVYQVSLAARQVGLRDHS
jgi:hypothetical protein